MEKNKKKKLLKWVNHLDINELYSLYKIKLDDLEVPSYLDNVVYNKIDEEIKRERKNVFIKTGRLIRNYALNFGIAFIIIICIIGSIFLTNLLKNNNQNNCIVVSVKGNAIVLDENNKKSNIRKNKKIKKSSVIESKKGSLIELRIGKKSFITINENSRIKINELFKKNDIEKTNLFVDSGEIICQIDKQQKDSLFEVETENLKVNIKGTKFIVNTSDELTNVIVEEGIINTLANVKINKDIDFIEKINPDIAYEIKKSINKGKTLYSKQKLEIASMDLKNSEENIAVIINSIKNELEENVNSKFKTDEVLKKSRKNILFINDLVNKLYHIENIKSEKIETQKNDIKKEKIDEDNKTNQISDESDDKNELLEGNDAFKIQKLPGNPGLTLTENKTAITNDGKNIYITSNSNKSIYSINSKNGKLNWDFNDNKQINNFNNFAFAFRINNDNKKHNYKKLIETEIGIIPSTVNIVLIILTTQDKIFITEQNKRLFRVLTQQDNDNYNKDYWSLPVKTKDDDVYIPFNNKLYKFNINSISMVGNFKDVNDQLFVSCDENNLYCLFKNEKILRVYELKDLYEENFKKNKKYIEDKKIKWESKYLKNISVIPPLVINDYIFTADIAGNIYKYKIYSDKEPQIISIVTGIVSNIIFKNGNLFFVANDGYFYKVNISTFNSYDRIIKVDNNPDFIKYNTKRIITYNNDLFFCSDTGNLFWFNVKNNKSYMITINENNDKLPLIASPQLINNEIFVFDTKSNIYKLIKK